MNAESYIPIGSLQVDKTYTQTFLVAEVVHSSKMRTKTGTAYARVTLRDMSGEIAGVIWNYDNNLTEGDYYAIKLETKLYAKELEFSAHLSDTKRVSIPLNHFDYTKGVSDSMLAAYAGEIEDNVMSIPDDTYRDIMSNAVEQYGILKDLRNAPYGIEGSMAYRGGLLVHVTHSMRLAFVAISQAKELEIPFNASLVVAGCVLRNIGWQTTTYFQDGLLLKNDSYDMIRIYPASVQYINRLVEGCKASLGIKIPEAKRLALVNICNQGADINTVEGKIVACADNMADVLDFSVASLQRKPKGNWRNELFTGHLT